MVDMDEIKFNTNSSKGIVFAKLCLISSTIALNEFNKWID